MAVYTGTLGTLAVGSVSLLYILDSASLFVL